MPPILNVNAYTTTNSNSNAKEETAKCEKATNQILQIMVANGGDKVHTNAKCTNANQIGRNLETKANAKLEHKGNRKMQNSNTKVMERLRKRIVVRVKVQRQKKDKEGKQNEMKSEVMMQIKFDIDLGRRQRLRERDCKH